MRNIIRRIVLIVVMISAAIAQAGPQKEKTGKALEILFFDKTQNKSVSPEDSLRHVVSVMHWNDTNGALDMQSWELLRKNIDSDLGEVATILYERGFNYSVLHYLRLIVKHTPGEPKFGSVDVSQIPESKSAGVPAFVIVNTDKWQTSLTGNLRIEFRQDVHWLLDQMRTMRDHAIYYAGHTRYLPWSIFGNRYGQIQKILDYVHRMERSLTQIQSVIASIQIKRVRYQSQSDVESKLAALEESLNEELTKFAEGLSLLFAEGQPTPGGDTTPWKELYKAIEKHQEKVSVLESKAVNKAIKTIEDIDLVTGTSKSNNKYSDDEIPELVLQLDKQRSAFKKLLKKWSDVSEFTYHDRVHKWLYVHKHSEQHMPYMEVSRSYKSRNVGGIELAPIEDETEVAEFLAEQSVRITDKKLEREQILELRSQLLQIQAKHQSYVKNGAVTPPNIHPNQIEGFQNRFNERNSILRDWLELMIDSTYRHEAHEQKGYVGIELESELSEETNTLMEKLATKAKVFKRIRIGIYSTGTASAIGTACYYFLIGNI